MNKQIKDIDKLFRAAASAESAPDYKDAYWGEMNALLDAQDKKRSAFIGWMLLGSVVSFLLLFLLFKINNQEEAKYIPTELTHIEKEKYDPHQISNSNNEIQRANLTKNNTAQQHLKTKVIVENQGKIKPSKSPGLNPNSATKENQRFKEVLQTHTISQTDKPMATTVESLQANDFVGSLSFEKRHALDNQNNARIVFTDNIYYPSSKLHLSLRFSGGIMENYKTSRRFESGVFDLSINAGTNFKNILIRTGMGVQTTTHADLVLTHKTRVYDFGVTHIQNDLSYQELYDVFIPLEFGYAWNKTSFGVGLQFNYLFATSMNYNQYANKEVVIDEKYYGNTDGLKRFSSQGYLWLEHQIYGRFGLGMKVGTTISSRIKENSYFMNSSVNNPVYGQIYLRYKLF